VTLRNVFLIVGVLPLAVLTASSFFGNPAVPQPQLASENPPELDPKKLETSVDEAKQNAETEEPFVTGIAFLDVFGAEPKAIPIDPTDRLAKLGARLQNLVDACGLLRAYADICTQRKPSDASVRDQLKSTFQQPKTRAALANAEELRTLIDERVDELDRTLAYREGFKKAEKAFADGQLEDCRKTLAALDAKDVPADDQSSAKALSKKVAFLLHWKDVPSGDQPIRDRRRKLDELVRTSPPPEGTEQDDFLKRRREDALSFARQIRVGDRFASPPASFRELAEDCQRILAEDPASRDRLRDGVLGWIKARLTAKPKVAISDIVKEAWTKDHRYLQGVFEAVPSENHLFKYWSKVAEFQNNQPYEHDLYLSDLLAEPVRPLEMRLTDQFNGQLAELLKDVSVQGRWESFAKQCSEWQKQITEYYSKRQLQGGPLSFNSSRELAEEILSQWKFMDRLFKN
jgi:hypothetical protein